MVAEKLKLGKGGLAPRTRQVWEMIILEGMEKES